MASTVSQILAAGGKQRALAIDDGVPARRGFLRDLLKGMAAGFSALLLGCALWTGGGAARGGEAAPAPAARAAGRPNIIVIMADDVSAREFSCYGHRKARRAGKRVPSPRKR